MQKGLRYNEGKLKWQLLPYDALAYLVKIFMYGAEKYKPENWKKGFSYKETFDSAMRHLTDFYLRKDIDEESGLLTIGQACWNCLILLYFELHRNIYKKFDDRPKRMKK